MMDYQPLDLHRYCNVGTGFFHLRPLPGPFVNPRTPPPIGRQSFHGLPFGISGDPERCYIGLAAEQGLQGAPVQVPIGQTARWIIFCHALLETKLPEGEPAGRVVAVYTLQLAGGLTFSVPVRERFEVSAVPADWGELPFLARPDRADWMMPRYAGQWNQMGQRQTEAVQGYSLGYYLWAWQNPQPDRIVESLRVEPAGRKFVLAAVTLGHLEEEPFCEAEARPVTLTLRRPEDARRPFNLQVDVDRGVASYPYPLPESSTGDFLQDDYRGWGEAPNETSTPAYVQVAANPSATIQVSAEGELLGAAKWADLSAAGSLETPRIRLEIVDRGRNWVHVTVLDEALDRPVPCRVHFRSPEGIPYQPHGHPHSANSNLATWHVDIGGDLRLGQITYAYIDGRCQGWLPRGEVLVDVACGYEVEPLRTVVRIEPGQRALTLRLKRWTDMNARRWFSGDSHVHFIGAQGAHREAQGEDLNVVNLLASQWGHMFSNGEDFIGQPSLSNGGRTIVYCSQENRQHFLGHLTLWGLKQPVMPWCTDGPNEAELGGSLEETLSHWADAAHAQGGTVILPHFPHANCEPAALVATGRADAVEMILHGDFQHLEYYRYLTCGYRLPLVGGTDKMSADVPVGLYRTYAYIPPDEEFNYDNWCKAVRAGRTFLSGGPMLNFTVDGQPIGDTLNLPAGGGTVEVEATAECIFPIHTLEIVQAGQVVASTIEQGGARRLRLKASLKIEGHTWLAARCGGPNYISRPHHDEWRRGIFAHTSPVYLAVGGPWQMFDPETAQYRLTLLDGGLAYVQRRTRHYHPGRVTHHHGEADHLAYLERPFREAHDAITRRMTQQHSH